LFAGIREELRLARLVRSIEEDGVLTPILRDGPHVIQGHRRVVAYASLMSTSPEKVLDILPYEERALSKVDRIWQATAVHGGSRLPLSEWEEFRAIELLYYNGVTDRFQVAAHFGKSAGWAQTRLTLAKLPKFIKDSFRRWLTSESPDVKLRWDAVPKLYKTFNEEYSRYPAGDGPALTGLFASLSSITQRPRRTMYTEGEVKAISARTQSPLLRRLLDAILNSEDLTLIDQSLAEHNL